MTFIVPMQWFSLISIVPMNSSFYFVFPLCSNMQTEILKIDQNTLRNTYAEIYQNILNKSEIMRSNVAISIAREEMKGWTKGRNNNCELFENCS